MNKELWHKEIIEKLERYSNEFRRAIELAIEDGKLIENDSLRGFPKASCGHASDLLQRYLLEKGIPTLFVSATTRFGNSWDDESHAWLEYNGIVIDITGDQYNCKETLPSNNRKCYVGYYDDLHNSFEILKKYEYSESSDERLKDLENDEYETIIKYVK